MNSREHPDFCTRVAPAALCFCGHPLASHGGKPRKVRGVVGGTEKEDAAVEQPPLGGGCVGRCGDCECRLYKYVPHRPEEVGEFWLPRRRGFRVADWRAKCTCKHGSDAHGAAAPHRCRTCSCGMFVSDFRSLPLTSHSPVNRSTSWVRPP
jgi:hypothetical protein